MCSTSTKDEVVIENVPNIRDVNILINLLKDLSVEVNQTSDDTYRFKAEKNKY